MISFINGILASKNNNLIEVDCNGIGYEIFTEKSQRGNKISGDAMILVNGNGKIKKSGTVTDMDGLKVTVKDYVVTKIVDENKTTIYEAE